MSMWRYDFVVWGFDLSLIQDPLSEWLNETDEGIKCYDALSQRKVGQWTIFDDPMNNAHYILGYVIAKADQSEGFIRPVEIENAGFRPGYENIPDEFRHKIMELTSGMDKIYSRIFVFTEWW